MINKYLENHSLDKNFVKGLGWTWTKNDTKITIPIYDINGKILYSRYRHLAGINKFTQDKGSHPALYCLHKIIKKPEVVLCEGEPDAARLWQEGIPAVTGTSGAKAFSKTLAEPLRGKTIKICLDTDKAGVDAVISYYKILEETGATPKIIQLPKQFKDVSEFFAGGATRKSFENLPLYEDLESWQLANIPDEFKWKNTQDILIRKIQKEKWLIDKIIPVEGFCFFVGPEASAKTFYSLMLADCVATGKSWLGQFKTAKQTNVLIIDKENTERRIQDRLRGLKITTPNIHWLEYPQYLEIADKETESGYSRFIETISLMVKKEKIGLIILDSLTDILVGEENDRGDTQKFFDAIRQLFPKIAVLPIHHAGKIQAGLKRPTSQMARGSSNLMAQAYTAFHCEPVRRSTVEFTVEQTKAGDAEKMGKFRVEIQTVPDPLNDGETLVTGFEYLGEVQDSDEKLAIAIDLFIEAMKTTPRIPRQELADQLEAEGVSKSTFGRVIRQLKEEKRIEMVKSETVARGSDVVLKSQDYGIVYE